MVRVVVLALASVIAVLCASDRALAAHRDEVEAETRRRGGRIAVTAEARREAPLRGHDVSSPVHLRAGDRELLAFAPASRLAERPITVVYLHGTRGLAAKGCPWMREGASQVGWLVCPDGAHRDEAGTFSWGADLHAQRVVVDAAISAAVAEGARPEAAVAVGFSQGAYVAVDLLKTGLARFQGLVLLGAETRPSAVRLREAGVQRVVLGAGRRDAAFGPMKAHARALADDGLEARFLDLGEVGHTYTAKDTGALREAIAWAGGDVGARP